MTNHFVDPLHTALKQYHGDSFAPSPLAHLTLYQIASSRGAPTPRQATNEVLDQALSHLAKSKPDDAQLIKMRFLDDKSAQEVANHLNVSLNTLYTHQREGLKQLADAALELEYRAHVEQRQRLLQRLEPLGNIHVVGLDDQLNQLMKLVEPGGAPWITSIEGLGGIGKTTLADALLRRVIETNLYHEIGWVSARESRLTVGGTVVLAEKPALSASQLIERLYAQLFPHLFAAAANDPPQMLETLQRRLKALPHLIVVDNLETVTDLKSLLPTLQTLTNPTKFILTSRERTFGEPNVSHHPVAELGETETLALVRQEASINNLPELAACPHEILTPIYETVGGNPLAIRLVVGQTHVHTLTSILDDLKQARGQPIENLYTYIYWKAWESLDAVSQSLFLATVFLNQSGDDAEFLAGVSEIPLEQVRNALNVLVTRNLLDVRGDFSLRLYTIHGLTRTFLHKQVAKWGVPNEGDDPADDNPKNNSLKKDVDQNDDNRLDDDGGEGQSDD